MSRTTLLIGAITLILYTTSDARAADETAPDVPLLLSSSSSQHVIAEFQSTPTRTEKRALRHAGVTLLRPLGPRAYFASLDADRYDPATLARLPNLHSLQLIELEHKLHSALQAQSLGHTSDSTVAVNTLFHADADLAAALLTCQRHGARIQSVLDIIHGAALELPASAIPALADEDVVQWLEPALPALSETNDSVRAAVGATLAQEPPYNLDGAGVSVLVYDSGTVAATHNDFDGRATRRDSTPIRDHATQVAGTIGGSGLMSGGTYRGIAPAVTIESYGYEIAGDPQVGPLYADPGDLQNDYAAAVGNYGVVLANNSIGSNVESNNFDCTWQGDYGVTSVLLDSIVRGGLGTPLCIVWSVGNERAGDRCDVEGFGDYYSLAPPAAAKNPIVVGAVQSDTLVVTDASSWGPTDDGRLKPDLVAPGCQSSDDFGVTSCDTTGDYASRCSTSMATAAVTGISALLIQQHRLSYPAAPDPLNSTIKALLVNTAADEVAADDLPGPDYHYGYGLVQVVPAVDAIIAGNFLESDLDQDEIFTTYAVVGSADSELRVTLAWDDAPGTPNMTAALINDLDLLVYDPSESPHYPWTLDPNNPSAAAIRSQPDHTNNIEQVVITGATPGIYRIEVTGHAIPDGPQTFSLCATPSLLGCTSAGTIALDRAAYGCATLAQVWVTDCDLNTDPNAADAATAIVWSDSEPGGESILLTEVAPDAGAFIGTLPVSDTDATGVLWVTAADTITAEYLDVDNGAGETDVLVTSTATVECTPPAITSIVVTDIDTWRATIAVDVNEPCRVAIRYGTDCALLDQTELIADYATQHTIELTDLAPDTTIYFAIDAVDVAGNTTTDDNAGLCHTFDTLAVPTFFIEEFAADFDLDHMLLRFTPDESLDFYTACADVIVELPIDPAGGAQLALPEDGYLYIEPNEPVTFYTQQYDGFYVGSNGYLTFTAGDSGRDPTPAAHFALPRIAPLFCDLSPQAGTVSWRAFDEGVAVTWTNVPTYGTSNANTFQIVLYADGTVELAWLDVAADTALVGLSAGNDLDPSYMPLDLSNLTACGPRPPRALDLDLVAVDYVPLTIALVATDDGLPDPPGYLTYTITAAPAFELVDPGTDEVIDPNDLPYTLVDSGHEVVYRCYDPWTITDSFTYVADDGGESPTGGESSTATVSLTINEPARVYRYPLHLDPNWATDGLWEFGVPLGGGSYTGDPDSGYTGTKVYGYNLAGDYANNLADAEYLTTGAFDCTGLWRTELRYWRWLGIEAAAFDHARIEVSTDGASWTTAWQHLGGAVLDDEWSQQTVSIMTPADDAATVYIRWGLGPTDSTGTAFGWNIDDVELWAVPQPLPAGDMNCDGVFGYDDINAFVSALIGPEHYAEDEPDCNYWNADVNRDGQVSFADINPFVRGLLGLD